MNLVVGLIGLLALISPVAVPSVVPGPVRTITIPGPVVTVPGPPVIIPGPVRTEVVTVPVPGPTKTVTVTKVVPRTTTRTITAQPSPAPTTTVTEAGKTPRPIIHTTPGKTIHVSVPKAIGISIFLVILGGVILLSAMALMYHLGMRKERDEEQKFLRELRRLVRR